MAGQETRWLMGEMRKKESKNQGHACVNYVHVASGNGYNFTLQPAIVWKTGVSCSKDAL